CNFSSATPNGGSAIYMKQERRESGSPLLWSFVGSGRNLPANSGDEVGTKGSIVAAKDRNNAVVAGAGPDWDGLHEGHCPGASERAWIVIIHVFLPPAGAERTRILESSVGRSILVDEVRQNQPIGSP